MATALHLVQDLRVLRVDFSVFPEIAKDNGTLISREITELGSLGPGEPGSSAYT